MAVTSLFPASLSSFSITGRFWVTSTCVSFSPLSASTGQVLSEALGLALPGSALIPATLTRHMRVARAVGKQILKLVEMDLRPSKILTREAFENAIALHAAVGGSGARVVLEVRSHKVPFVLEDGQIIGRLIYERLTEAPDTLYGQDLGSNYQGQSLKLSKHFK